MAAILSVRRLSARRTSSESTVESNAFLRGEIPCFQVMNKTYVVNLLHHEIAAEVVSHFLPDVRLFGEGVCVGKTMVSDRKESILSQINGQKI